MVTKSCAAVGIWVMRITAGMSAEVAGSYIGVVGRWISPTMRTVHLPYLTL